MNSASLPLLKQAKRRPSAYIYNPYHYLILLGLSLAGVQFDTVFISKRLNDKIKRLPSFSCTKVVVLVDSFKSSSLLRRILSLPVNFGKIIGSRPSPLLLVANDRSLVTSLYASVRPSLQLMVIDEGALDSLMLMESAVVKKRRSLADRIFGRFNRLENPKITHVISESENLSRVSDLSLIDARFVVQKALDHLRLRLNNYDSSFATSFLLVTSPLTENGNVGAVSETKLVESLLQSNPSHNFFLKMHYREAEHKYKSLLTKFENLSSLPDEIDMLPGQVISDKFMGLIGFHSSLICQAGISGLNAFSMSLLVNSDHSKRFVSSAPPKVHFLDSTILPV